MQTAEMVREKQINMRLSEEESARLDFLTGHYGINTSALLRMLLKKEETAVRATLPRSTTLVRDPLKDSKDYEQAMYDDVLRAIRDLDRPESPAPRAEIPALLNKWGWDARDRSLPRRLNELRDAGYLTRVNRNGQPGYRLTDRGRAWFEPDTETK